jgi:magnesium transporter
MEVMVLLCRVAALLQRCIKDSDCLNKLRPDLHSNYCVNSICQRIMEAGKPCTRPTDCASFLYYGPLACTAQCKIEQECEHFSLRSERSVYCCRGIPSDKRCSPDRPGMLSGCDMRQSCVLGTKGVHVCVSGGSSSWMLGVFLSVSGNLGINLGINLQKKSYVQTHLSLFNIQLQMFYLGCFVYGIGKILGYSSYVFGNQSLIAALSASGLVSNSVLAPMINQEVFTWKDLSAIFFVFCGSTLIVMNTTIGHRVYTLCELMKMYRRPGTILWFTFIASSIVVLYAFVKFVELNSNWRLPNEQLLFLERESVWFPEEGKVLKYWMVLAYVLLSSFIASFTTLSIKSLSEMIDKTIAGDNQFIFLTTYLFIVTLAMCTFLQIYWLNRALRYYDALIVIPIFHVSWTLLSITTAGIYFQEFEYYTAYQVKVFVAGVLVIFVGSFFLGSRIVDKNRIETKRIEVQPRRSTKRD